MPWGIQTFIPRTMTAEQDTFLRRALLGDKEALGELLMSYRPMVGSLVYKFLGKHELTHYEDDVVGDVLLAAVAGFKRYKPQEGASFSTWLGTVAVNQCRNFLRKGLDREVPLEYRYLDWNGEEIETSHADAAAVRGWMMEQQGESFPPMQPNNGNKRRGGLRARLKEKALRRKRKKIAP